MTLADEVWGALDTIADPCSVQLGKPMTMVSMGLIESVLVTDSTIEIGILLTEPSCVFAFKFFDDIDKAVEPLTGGRELKVHMQEDMLWTPDRMHSRPENVTISARG